MWICLVLNEENVSKTINYFCTAFTVNLIDATKVSLVAPPPVDDHDHRIRFAFSEN